MLLLSDITIHFTICALTKQEQNPVGESDLKAEGGDVFSVFFWSLAGRFGEGS